MDSEENIEILRNKLEELESGLDKQKKKKSIKSLFSLKSPGITCAGITVSFLSKLINSSVDGVIAADKEGNLLIYNDAAACIFGYDVDEALSSVNIRDIYPGKGACEIMGKLRSEEYGGIGKLSGYLVNILSKDGETIPVRINASIVYEDDCEIATIGYLRDLRDTDGASNVLLKTNKPKSEKDQGVSLHAFLSGLTEQLQLYDQKFCVGAIENELASIDQVKKALKKQSEIFEKTKVHVPIGRIMIQLGFLTGIQRDAIVNLQRMEIQKITSDADLQQVEESPAPSEIENRKDNQALMDLMKLEISADQLKATIHIEADDLKRFTTPEILKLIENAGIIYGIVDESMIENYLRAEQTPTERFIVAHGKAPAANKPPEIQYLFRSDPLGVGTAREAGTIDWKNRGKLPQAKVDDVIAEIIPGVEGSSGTDVFGTELLAPAIKPALFKCGKGVAMSDDGTQYLAKRNGMVVLSDDRKITILETLAIAGDIGLETGHIDYDGHVEVSGSVHKGYRVNCKSLRAEEIQEAEITVAGDMIVMGGIYDSTVKCKDNLQASHIHKSNIQTGGELFVEKEIMESKIESSGKCMIADGTIIFSEVKAKNGIFTNNIGTKGSKPSMLFIGIDENRKRKIKYAKKKLALQKKELDQLPKEIEELQIRLETLEGEAAELTKKLSKYTGQIDNKENQIKNINAKEQLNTMKDKIDRTLTRISQKNEALHNGRDDLDRIEEELDLLVAENETNQEEAIVHVNGIIYPGTTVTGPNATLTTSQAVSRLYIKEIKKVDEDRTELWIMHMHSMG